MIYPYQCDQCRHKFEVIKSHREMDQNEACPSCLTIVSGKSTDEGGCRYIARTHFYGAKVEDAEFNPGLGCITKGKKDRERIARQRGLIEVGNECPDAMHKREEQTLKERDAVDYDSTVADYFER